jgi:hypothetical protein
MARPKRTCPCGRPATYRRRGGRVRADDQHSYCRQCWQAIQDRIRAWRLKQ